LYCFACAHSKNVAVQAELGAVGDREGNVEGEISPSLFTDPHEAQEFVRRTAIDALAVGIGTVHGLYQSAPNLQFDLLETIADKVDIPLVLHGGTGPSQQDFSRVIDRKISKINSFRRTGGRLLGAIPRQFKETPGPRKHRRHRQGSFVGPRSDCRKTNDDVSKRWKSVSSFSHALIFAPLLPLTNGIVSSGRGRGTFAS